ncbi:YuzL family protein [Bacillus sp. BHET2]|nr:YuzL family protein [Bacillus sp. BHET2]TMU84485.1 YuzL family protein [Bacillus sp. BHET2]
MAKQKKDPSKAGVSAASVKGDAGPTVERDGGGKRNSQNNQFKKQP